MKRLPNFEYNSIHFNNTMYISIYRGFAFD